MRTFNEFRQKLDEFASIEATKDSLSVMKFMNYFGNNYYVHFGNSGKIHMPKKTRAPHGYATTPAAFYAWQMNSYKRKNLMHIISACEASIKGDRKEIFYPSFPYGNDREYAYIVEAKPGLKWLNVRRDLKGGTLQKIWDNFTKGYHKPTSYEAGLKRYTLEEMKAIYKQYSYSGPIVDQHTWKEEMPYIEYPPAQQNSLLRVAYKKAESIPRFNSFGVFVYRYIDLFFSDRNHLFRDLLIKSGFDAIRDDGAGVIFNSEKAQVGFFKKEAFRHMATFRLSYDKFIITPDVAPVIKARAEKLLKGMK